MGKQWAYDCNNNDDNYYFTFGEVIPKSIATGSSEKISFIIATYKNSNDYIFSRCKNI